MLGPAIGIVVLFLFSFFDGGYGDSHPCEYKVKAKDNFHYQVLHGDKYVKRPCPPGTVTNPAACHDPRLVCLRKGAMGSATQCGEWLTASNECLWKPCRYFEGPSCYKVRPTDDSITVPWVQTKCEDGLYFNPLVCVTHNASEVCLPKEDVEEILEGREPDEFTDVTCRNSWTLLNGKCLKRLGNHNTKTIDECEEICENRRSRLVEPRDDGNNRIVRTIGASSNKYWTGLRLNDALSGWYWASDDTQLTDDQAAFADGSNTTTTLEALLNSYNEADRNPNIGCIVLMEGDEWEIRHCNHKTQCMCETDIELI